MPQSPAQFLCDRKEYGQLEYEPDTISSFSQSIQQFLNDNNAKVKEGRIQGIKRSPEIQTSGTQEAS